MNKWRRKTDYIHCGENTVFEEDQPWEKHPNENLADLPVPALESLEIVICIPK